MTWVSPPVLSTGDLVTAADWNSNFSYLTDSGWIVFPLVASWVSNAGPGGVPSYRRIGNVVRICGTYDSTGKTSPAAGSSVSVGTLPSGYRPTYDHYVVSATQDNATLTQWVITSAGVVTPFYGSGAFPVIDTTYTVD